MQYKKIANCTVVAHGTYPSKLSYFNNELYKSIVLLFTNNKTIDNSSINSNKSTNNVTINNIENNIYSCDDREANSNLDDDFFYQNRTQNLCTIFNNKNIAWNNMRNFFYTLADYDYIYHSVDAIKFSSSSNKLINEDIFVFINGKYKKNKLKLWNR